MESLITPTKSKLIRLRPGVYDELEEIRLKRETFSQVVSRLLRAYVTLNNALRDSGVRELGNPKGR